MHRKLQAGNGWAVSVKNWQEAEEKAIRECPANQSSTKKMVDVLPPETETII